MEQQRITNADFHTNPGGFAAIKVVAGIAQMVFGVIAFVVNYYFFEETLVELAAFATFGFGLVLVGVIHETVISPKRKTITIKRGYLVPFFQKQYSSSEVERIRVIKKTRMGTDPNGIGPEKEQVLITTYYVEMVLRNSVCKTLTSQSDKEAMNNLAILISKAINVPVDTL